MTNVFRILLLLVVPGHLIFSFTISLLEAGHTIPTFLFVITYLAAALLQVCKLAAGKKIIIKWSNFIQFNNNVKENRTSCCTSGVSPPPRLPHPGPVPLEPRHGPGQRRDPLLNRSWRPPRWRPSCPRLRPAHPGWAGGGVVLRQRQQHHQHHHGSSQPCKKSLFHLGSEPFNPCTGFEPSRSEIATSNHDKSKSPVLLIVIFTFRLFVINFYTLA